MNLQLLDYNESERADYMMVVASMAGQDGAVTSEEVFAVRQLSLQYLLGPDARGRVMAAAAIPPENLDGILERLAETNLRYSLLLDLAGMAYRDGVFTEAEAAEYNRLSQQLRVPENQSRAVLDFAGAVLNHKGKPDEHLATLEKAGIPGGVVSLSAIFMSVN
ncbi:MAG: TerB family tellurite resistance protein [Candidatus Eremiobacteraeota bacterium]|nr:TerB family tellurite resistance protein [Candidatus Eremiobacteraeota bacterium]MCW5868442.1 TerB family tellurite resistance protein [Candidatus Eremiobacteraeota bacterium]